MPKGLKWFEKTVFFEEKYTTRTILDKLGREYKRFYVDGKRVKEAIFNRRHGLDVYMQQLRGFARKTGILDYKEATKIFGKLRGEHRDKIAKAEKQFKRDNDKDKLERARERAQEEFEGSLKEYYT